MRRLDWDKIAAMSADGMTPTNIAEELGSHPGSVRRILEAMSIPFNGRGGDSIRQRISGMTQSQAIEHLLHLVDILLPVSSGMRTPPGLENVHFTRMEEALLDALVGAGDYSAPYERIISSIEARCDRICTSNEINVCLVKLRRKLVGTKYRIVNDWGRGYRLEHCADAGS